MQLRLQFTNPFKDNRFARFSRSAVLALVFFGLGVFAGPYLRNSANLPLPTPLNIQISGVENADTPEEISQQADFQTFWKIWGLVQEKYVGRKELDYQKMLYGSINGMLSALDDPYTVFFDAETNKEFQEEISGKFEGVGIELGIKNDVLTVVAPLDNTPAQQAGLKSKDQILAIDDQPTKGMSTDEAVKLIRGEHGTQVTLSIMRVGFSEPKDFVIRRAVIDIPTVTKTYIGDDIVHLKVHNFYEPSQWAFRKAALETMLSGRKKIILDLRNNPGGYFDLAVEFAGWFLPPDSVAAFDGSEIVPLSMMACCWSAGFVRVLSATSSAAAIAARLAVGTVARVAVTRRSAAVF